jgi:predicted RND superfamily exporter protein
LVLIALLLLVVLRSVVDAAYVLAPLALAGTLTFATSALAGLSINFANIIVLPLLLGLGVSSGIYLVTRAREEPGRMLLQTITPRAVVFSALTTMASFGSLIVSGHLGMSSMGWLLLIAISLSLACTLVVLPALLVLRYRGAGVARNADRSR